jgi:hypothetical protein
LGLDLAVESFDFATPRGKSATVVLAHLDFLDAETVEPADLDLTPPTVDLADFGLAAQTVELVRIDLATETVALVGLGQNLPTL